MTTPDEAQRSITPTKKPSAAQLQAALLAFLADSEELLDDVQDMRCKKPEAADPDETKDDDDWFGDFSNGATDNEGPFGFARNFIAWPNLSITAETLTRRVTAVRDLLGLPASE